MSIFPILTFNSRTPFNLTGSLLTEDAAIEMFVSNLFRFRMGLDSLNLSLTRHIPDPVSISAFASHPSNEMVQMFDDETPDELKADTWGAVSASSSLKTSPVDFHIPGPAHDFYLSARHANYAADRHDRGNNREQNVRCAHKKNISDLFLILLH